MNGFLKIFAAAVSLTDICLHFTIYLESFGKEHLKNWHRKLEFAKWIWPWCLLSSSDFSNASCGQIYTFQVSKQNLFLTSGHFWSHGKIKKHRFLIQHITTWTLNVVQLKDKHCPKPNCSNGVIIRSGTDVDLQIKKVKANLILEAMFFTIIFTYLK